MNGELETRTLTLVIQRVAPVDEPFTKAVALALLEYAADCLNGTGGNGQFERHVTANRCRIEAIASVPAILGQEAKEGLVGTADASDALRDRLDVALEIANYLPGGEHEGDIASAMGYDPKTAADELRQKLQEARDAL